MRRLDSPTETRIYPWFIYLVLAFFWFVVAKDFMFGNPTAKEKAQPILFYVLPLISIAVIWWFSSFKKVTLDKDTLLVSGFQRESRIPLYQIEKIYERGGGGRSPGHITIKFKSGTEFGRRVRFFIGSRADSHKVAKLLKSAMEGKNLGVRINRISIESKTALEQFQKEIIVRGWTNAELPNILSDFADTYDEDLGKNFDFEVYSHDGETTRITFPHDISAKHFSFLVNYLNYPKNYDLKTRAISVTGNATLSGAFHPPNKNLIGKKATFYVPSNDKDYDLVYVRVGDETFQNSFASSHWKKVEDSRIPAGIKTN